MAKKKTAFRIVIRDCVDGSRRNLRTIGITSALHWSGEGLLVIPGKQTAPTKADRRIKQRVKATLEKLGVRTPFRRVQ